MNTDKAKQEKYKNKPIQGSKHAKRFFILHSGATNCMHCAHINQMCELSVTGIVFHEEFVNKT